MSKPSDYFDFTNPKKCPQCDSKTFTRSMTYRKISAFVDGVEISTSTIYTGEIRLTCGKCGFRMDNTASNADYENEQKALRGEDHNVE